MSMPRSKLELDAIERHIDAAQKAAGIASSYLSDAMGPRPEDVTPEQWREGVYLWIALAATASRVADTHTRLLELKLAIGDSAL